MTNNAITRTNLIQFDSLTEVARYIDYTPRTKIFRDTKSNSSDRAEKQGGTWFGTTCLTEALYLLKYGWDEKTKEMQEILDKPSISQQQFVKSFYNDVLGFQALVPNYLMGLPKSMVNSRMRPVKSKIIDLCATNNYSCKYSAKEIFENAIRQVLVVNSLESKGYRVNLSVANFSRSFNGEITNIISTRIKRSDERLNLSKLSFALIHPSMFRRIYFALFERLDVFASKYYTSDYGYGQAMRYEQIKENKEIQQLMKGQCILPSFISKQDLKDEEFYENLINFAK